MADKTKVYNSDLPIQDKAAFLIICSAQELLNKLSGIAKEFNISLTQLQILHVLDEVWPAPITINTIRELLVEDSPNVSRSVNKLVEKNLATKKRSDKDQRIVHVSITDAGKSVHHRCDKKIIGNTISLSKKDSNVLAELLMKV